MIQEMQIVLQNLKNQSKQEIMFTSERHEHPDGEIHLGLVEKMMMNLDLTLPLQDKS